MSDVSNLLRSLTKNERMSESLFYFSKLLICSIFWAKNKWFPQKNNKRIPNLADPPASPIRPARISGHIQDLKSKDYMGGFLNT